MPGRAGRCHSVLDDRRAGTTSCSGPLATGDRHLGAAVPFRPVAPRLDYDADASLLVRTDFTDHAAWEKLVEDATLPYGEEGFSAYFSCISDRAFDGMTVDDLEGVEGDARVVFAADRLSMLGDERTLIVVGRRTDCGRSFRVVLQEAWGPENNLRLANMDFADFTSAVDSDGVFRGFAR